MIIKSQHLMNIYIRLLSHFGPRGWWPGDSPLEVIIGAILTQSVAWRNVERAISNLKKEDLLQLWALYEATPEKIENCIISTLYYREKTKRIKSFIHYLVNDYHGNLDRLFSLPLEQVRNELLGLYGIGPETADSILLYAGGYPTFVVDAYTKRIFHRLGIFPENINYEEMRRFFMSRLEPDVHLFNEYHALIVALGNQYCLAKKPSCGSCPLKNFWADPNKKNEEDSCALDRVGTP